MSIQLTSEASARLRVPTALLTDHTYTRQLQETLAIVLKMPQMDHDATETLAPSVHFDDHRVINVASSLTTVNINALGLQKTYVSDHP